MEINMYLAHSIGKSRLSLGYISLNSHFKPYEGHKISSMHKATDPRG